MYIYDVAARKRQFDGKIAIWALMPDPTMSNEDLANIKVSSFANAPKTMTPPLRWVITAVCDTERDAHTFITNRFGRKH